MRSRVVLLAVMAGLAATSCGNAGSTASEAATAQPEPLHSVPADPVVVTGTATCVFSDDGVDPTGGDNTDLATCELALSDPRVSGTETHDRIRYHAAAGGWVWVVEEAVITNSEGTWRGIAQAVDDGTPIGEARYVGEGDYKGLVFHYYFSAPTIDTAEVHGWISTGE